MSGSGTKTDIEELPTIVRFGEQRTFREGIATAELDPKETFSERLYSTTSLAQTTPL
jgi:hypothetical protein